MGQNGFKPATGGMAKVKEAQASMENLLEFRGSVKCVRTDQFFYKFFNSVITYITNDQQIRRKSKENE